MIFGVLNALVAAAFFHFGSLIEPLKDIENPFGRAFIAGISYQVLVRSRITTVGDQPIGLEFFYEKIKGIVEWGIRKNVERSRSTRYEELQALSLEKLVARFDLRIAASVSIPGAQKEALLQWIVTMYTDKAETPDHKKQAISRKLLDLEIPDGQAATERDLSAKPGNGA